MFDLWLMIASILTFVVFVRLLADAVRPWACPSPWGVGPRPHGVSSGF